MGAKNWAEIIEELKTIGERIDSFADRLNASDVEEFYCITNDMHKLIAAANTQTGIALTEVDRLVANVSHLMQLTTFHKA